MCSGSHVGLDQSEPTIIITEQTTNYLLFQMGTNNCLKKILIILYMIFSLNNY